MQPATPTLRSATREEFDQTYAPRQLREGAVPLASATRGNELRFNISRGTQAIVVFTGGDVTQEAIDKLSRMLELQKDTYPTEEDLQTLEDYAQGKIKLEPEA
jgi:hypothetical protein